MRKGRLVKGLAIGMVCSMAFLSACGKQSGKQNGVITEGVDVPATEIDKDHVYSFEDMDFPDVGEFHVYSVCTSKDDLFVQAYITSNDEYRNVFYKMSFATGEFEEVKLDGNGTGDISYDNMTCDEEGNIYVVKHVYGNGDGSDKAADDGASTDLDVSEDGDNAADAGSEDSADDAEVSEEVVSEAVTDAEEGDFEENVYVVKASSDGKIIWEAPVIEEDAGTYIKSTAYVKGAGLLTCCDTGYSLYADNNGEGKKIESREAASDMDYFDAYLFRVKSGDVYLSTDEENETPVLRKFDVASLSFDENSISFPEGIYSGYGLYTGSTYDFYTTDRTQISGFNIGDEKKTEICDFTASNVIVDQTSFIGEAPDGKLIIAMDSNDGGESSICYLNKVDPAAIEDKEIITLGTVYLADSVRRQIVRFNKKSDKYKINILDYADYEAEDTGDTYMDSVNKLSLDITQGKSPDIIIVDSDMPFESYAVKGALEPLDPYFEADEEINTSDYLENVLDATKVNEKMYSVIPNFMIMTCVAAKDNLGSDTVTVDNYKDICKKNGIDPAIGMGSLARSEARVLYETAANSYIDYENGTCSFDSEDFVHFLEFVKALPENNDDIDYDKYESYYRENKSLLLGYWIGSFEDYQVLKKGYFGREISFNGYPGSKDGRSYISPTIQVAMSSACKNKQAAWDFIKSFMADDYQKRIDWGFPTEKSALDALAAKAQEKPYYIDSNGKKVETSSVWSIGGTEVNIGELSKEETQSLVEFVESVTTTANSDESVESIIEEEAAAFYEGQKTAEEVADIIQSRVSIYLSEQM